MNYLAKSYYAKEQLDGRMDTLSCAGFQRAASSSLGPMRVKPAHETACFADDVLAGCGLGAD
jgi:hypothetical protein